VLPCGKTARKNLSGAPRPEISHLGGATAALYIAYRAMMDEIEANQLKATIEQMHGGSALLAQSLPVRETFDGKFVWEGVVHVFDLTGHPTATRAYAWSSPIAGSTKRRFFAVLHQPPVDSPQAAVRAAIVAEHQRK
jgi:hypothetical protein